MDPKCHHAIALIHSYNVVHADISPRNFLVAEDLSIKLCDFAGSGIGDLESLVEEEDRYRISPWSPRTFQTDIFALGCLIYEISTGARPYNEIDDLEEVGKFYAAQTFPDLEGLRYGDIIFKCWTSQYANADLLREDYNRCIIRDDELSDPTILGHRFMSNLFRRPSVRLTLSIIGACSIFFWVLQKRSRR